MKTKNFYGIKTDGLYIEANTSDEAIRIFKNKFTPKQLRYSCISIDHVETPKQRKHLDSLCDYDTDGDGTPIGYRD